MDDKKQYVDAAIMNGWNLQAGAICAATQIKNPIKIANKEVFGIAQSS